MMMKEDWREIRMDKEVEKNVKPCRIRLGEVE